MPPRGSAPGRWAMSDHIEFGPERAYCFACGQPLPGAGEAAASLRLVEEDPLAAAEAGADRLERVIRYMRSAGYLPGDDTDDGGDAA